MPVPTASVIYDVHDAKIAPMTADPVGGAATYGTSVDVPGIAQIAIDPNFITAELKGDGGKVLARKGRADQFNAQLTYGRLSLPVLAAIFGGTVATGGTTPNETANYALAGTNSLGYFMLEVSLEDVELGLNQIVCTLFKAQVTGGTLVGQQTDQFGQPTLQVSGIARDSDDAMVDFEFRETLAALA